MLKTGGKAASFTQDHYSPCISWTTAHRWTNVISAVYLNHHHSGGTFRDLPPSCWFHVSHPFSIGDFLCHWPLSHHPQLEKQTSTPTTQVPQLLSPPLKALLYVSMKNHVILLNEPFRGWKWAKAMLIQVTLIFKVHNSFFFYFMGLYFIQDGPQNEK